LLSHIRIYFHISFVTPLAPQSPSVLHTIYLIKAYSTIERTSSIRSLAPGSRLSATYAALYHIVFAYLDDDDILIALLRYVCNTTSLTMTLRSHRCSCYAVIRLSAMQHRVQYITCLHNRQKQNEEIFVLYFKATLMFKSRPGISSSTVYPFIVSLTASHSYTTLLETNLSTTVRACAGVSPACNLSA
jgi:hypothetical protein